uniref:Uncharacterized protein ycf35 n=1 Tax=Kuetzingia canaliculata TaxID=228262 RepID=A0A1Z1MPU5_KUECA|nr:hypothetical protein [Kuetzingia canaliculata]ARW67791.1 hypothetical protein [Kuetzingia canaliculata]
MSHFSKVKTNISNLEILKLTVKQLGFGYTSFYSREEHVNSCLVSENLSVYDNINKPLFSFVWSGSEYNLVADLQLWSLEIDLSYFLDKLAQYYAYNIILAESSVTGFYPVNAKQSNDGSLRVTLQRWSANVF